MNKLVELPNCLPVGTRLAEFEIREVIGEGGFGIVYLAFDHSLQRTVAIKEYMPSALAARASDHTVSVRSKRHAEAFGAGLRSFINEARLLAQFDHPALVKVYRFWEQHGTAYMAMRYYQGRTFKTVCRDEPQLVTEAWLKALLRPILGALEALYAANILHRDISPENIMIQPDGSAVLLDFGAARQIVQDMAQSLTVILKPGFAPVEQYADDESMRQGAWTDIYSLSAVMYAAITGKAPPAAVARMLNDPIEPLASSGRPGYSVQFLEAIDRGMAVRPEVRPQSIAEFAALLGLDSLPGGTSVSAPAALPAQADATGFADPVAAAEATRAAVSRAKGAAGAPAAPGKPATPPAVPDKPRAAALPAAKAAKPAKSAPAAAAPSPRGKILGMAAAGLAFAIAGGIWFASDSPIVVAEQPAATAAAPEEAQGAADAPVPAAATAVAPIPVTSAAAAPQAEAASEPAAPALVTVAISVHPWATVYVDGEQKGVTPPLKKLTLSPGVHEIKLENPNFPTHVRKITVDGKKPLTIKHDFGT